MAIDPIRLAQQSQAEVRAAGTQRRVELQLEQDEAELPTFWQGWDPSQNRHTISRVGSQDQVTIATSISSGGFLPGRRYDTAYSKGYVAIDTRPYIRRTPVTITPEVLAIPVQQAILILETQLSQYIPDFFQLDRIRVWLKVGDSLPILLREEAFNIDLESIPDGNIIISRGDVMYSDFIIPIGEEEWLCGFSIYKIGITAAEQDDYYFYHYRNGIITEYPGLVQTDNLTIDVEIPENLRYYAPLLTVDGGGTINDNGDTVPPVIFDTIANTGILDWVGVTTTDNQNRAYRPYEWISAYKRNWYYPNDRANFEGDTRIGLLFSPQERYLFKNDQLMQPPVRLSNFYITESDLATLGFSYSSQWGSTQYWPPVASIQDLINDPATYKSLDLESDFWLFHNGQYDPVTFFRLSSYKAVPLRA
ncbi:MAG TPA: hypothetical protein V6C95_12090 [Coleofasciculaceae cyanobacterium]